MEEFKEFTPADFVKLKPMIMTLIDEIQSRFVASAEKSSEPEQFKNLLLRLQSLNDAQRREEALQGGPTEASIALDRRADELHTKMLQAANDIVASEALTSAAIAAKANVVLFYAEAGSEDVVHESARALAKSILGWLPRT